MAICDICYDFFIPRQTFETLFTPEKTCQSCQLDLKKPLRENHVPLFKNTLVVLTFESSMTAAFFHIIMKKILDENLTILFYENIYSNERETYRLVKALMKPVLLFHSDFMTLDTLERMETKLEAK